MKNEITSIVLTLILAAMPVLVINGQSIDDGWSNVTDLRLNTYVFVRSKKGRKIKGLVQSTSDRSINVLQRNTTITIDKDEIKSIHVGEQRNLEKAKNRGALFGMLAGVVIGGLLVTDTGDQDAMRALPAIVIGGGVGYLIGKKRGSKLKKGPLIYERK